MPKVLILVFAAAFLLRPAVGQNPTDLFSKAPPDVEEALRARVSKFFQAQVERKFRQAEQYVAEDSKDNYYEMSKTRYPKFEIRNIQFSSNFTKAVVVVLVYTHMAFPGFDRDLIPMPLQTNWKVVDGQWYWYLDQAAMNMTPFGKLTPGPSPDSDAGQTKPSGASQPASVQSVLGGIKVEKQVVELKSTEASSDQMVITSGLPGSLSLKLNPIDIPGLQIKFDPPELRNGEKTVVSFHYEPHGTVPPKSVRIYLIVSPIHYIIPVDVAFR
jgi:hypothetical protein